MCLLVLCLMPDNLLDSNTSFASFSGRLTISPVVERLVFSKVGSTPVLCINLGARVQFYVQLARNFFKFSSVIFQIPRKTLFSYSAESVVHSSLAGLILLAMMAAPENQF